MPRVQPQLSAHAGGTQPGRPVRPGCLPGDALRNASPRRDLGLARNGDLSGSKLGLPPPRAPAVARKTGSGSLLRGDPAAKRAALALSTDRALVFCQLSNDG